MTVLKQLHIVEKDYAQLLEQQYHDLKEKLKTLDKKSRNKLSFRFARFHLPMKTCQPVRGTKEREHI